MTKEELQEIADMYGLYTEQDVKNRLSCELLGIGARNEELEKENAELRNNGFTVSAMTEQQLKVALEKGEQLEKENAELKTDKQYWEQKSNRLAIEWGETLDQLAQAKKIIKGLLSCCRNYPQENAEKIKQAEQFFKDKSQNKWVNPITTKNDPFVK